MEFFSKFKEALKGSVAKLRRPGDPSAELLKAVEAADNWDQLEQRLIELRALSRKRQQEVLERLQPLADQIEAKIAEAKAAKIKVIKENLLRQAQGYMKQLEAEDEPARIHSANNEMLTGLIKQVQRARAMTERGVEANAIDLITTRLEEIVVSQEEVFEAAAELEEAGRIAGTEDVSVEGLEQRLSAVYDTGAESSEPEPAKEQTDKGIRDLEKELYE
ncbi:MAG: hypothetical protein JXR94_14075 [Candidatus Hydrogenedentes bacterium]|nr:hypothetical protein [Candidatus Hydrogenedentota bacterium]